MTQAPQDPDVITLSSADYTVIEPSEASGPTVTGTGGKAPASGPILSGSKPASSGRWKKWAAAGVAAIGLLAIFNSGEDAPAPAPATPPTTSAEPEAPQTPLAFRFLTVTGPDSVRVCTAPPSGGPSCNVVMRAAPGSCFQPFTDYNGSNPANGYLQVKYSEASGRVGTGFVELAYGGVAWSQTITDENKCLAIPATP